MKWKAVRAAYYEAFSDENLIENVVEIVSEIKANKWPDDSPLGLYTVGDLKAIEGFHGSKPMIEELLAAMTGRAIRGLALSLNLSLFDHSVQKLLQDTNDQTSRCVDKTVAKLTAKFGTPARIDEDRVTDLTTRAFRALNRPQ